MTTVNELRKMLEVFPDDWPIVVDGSIRDIELNRSTDDLNEAICWLDTNAR
jgi:hypothetical protein